MVPKLRFAGFNEPWSETSLGKISSFITSGSRDWAQYYADGGDKFIRMTNLVRDGITLNLSDLKFVRLPENSNEGKRTALQHHDILISITAELGKLGWVPDDLGTAYINQHTALVRPNLSIASSKFIANLLSTKKYNNILNQQNDSGAKSGLNLSTIKNFRFYATNKIEQTKIADFLSSVDEKITLLNKQYDLLCQYKKGMMQKIFSQELRFKDDSGRAFPEWKSTILDEVVDLITNGLALDQNDSKNGYPVSRIETISEHCINMNKVGFVNTDNDISNYKLNYGDMLFSNINSISHIGKIAYFNIDDTLYHGMNLLRIVIKNSHCKLFFYYQLTTDTNKKYFESRANQAVSQASINQTELRKTPVQVPCQEEQTKIASFLSALDDKIAVKKAELDKLKTWKQGLLQQMFV